MRQLTIRSVADCGKTHILCASNDLAVGCRSFGGWAVAQFYDVEVQRNGATIAAIRSVEVQEPTAIWLQVAELADCSFDAGCRIVITDQRGQIVMLLGLETVGLDASRRRRCASAARSQPPLQRRPPLPVALSKGSVELTRHTATNAGNPGGGV
jgi:hypothetical protein